MSRGEVSRDSWESILDVGRQRVPTSWGERPASVGGGTLFFDPENPYNALRIDPASERIGFVHVHVNRDGHTLGPNGEPVPHPGEPISIAEGVSHPHVREELLWWLDRMASAEYQAGNWVGLDGESSLDTCLTFLELNRMMENGLSHLVGGCLRSEAEAEALARMADLIQAVLESSGRTASDEIYLRDSGWPPVIDAAQAAQALLRERP